MMTINTSLNTKKYFHISHYKNEDTLRSMYDANWLKNKSYIERSQSITAYSRGSHTWIIFLVPRFELPSFQSPQGFVTSDWH